MNETMTVREVMAITVAGGVPVVALVGFLAFQVGYVAGMIFQDSRWRKRLEELGYRVERL